jgi:agmatinase
MFDSLVERFTGFMGATENYEEADIALVGIPMDFTVSFRPGTRMGPQQIRTVSYGIEEYSVYLDKDLADKSYFDLGDMNLPFGNVEGSLTVIENVTRRMLADKKFPILLGGEHLVTYPIIRAFKEQYQDLVVIHFDAHADLRLDYAGEPNSHATVMRKVAQMIEPKNLYQFGIRSGTSDEFQYAKENTNMFIDRVIEPLKQVIPTLGQRPVYVSLDIDVVDPAYAPGTGTPEAGGCSSREIIEAIHELGAANIVGFDLVEVSPATDQSERTSLLAAKIIRAAILAFC